ncbi:MAG: hypothetical protein JSW06_03745 [Thermoplasmatales archaeon]|nr:MAG: hypothetical protein JSW06_03745 [Thermoplasmatales archaeon]
MDEFRLENPLLSDYSSSIEGTGANINVTMHQSLNDTTRKEILNTSDPSQNSFTVPCPPDSDFNSTYTYIEVEDLYAPNKTIVIQDLNASYLPENYEKTITGTDHAIAGTFVIEQDMYLENISLYLGGRRGKNCGVELVVYN